MRSSGVSMGHAARRAERQRQSVAQSRRPRGRPPGHKSACVAHQLSLIDCRYGLDATLIWQGDHEDQAARLVAHYLA
jgi:hypothetical protein